MAKSRRSSAPKKVDLPDSVSRAELRKRCQKMLVSPRGESELARDGYVVAVTEFLCLLSERDGASGTV